MKALTILGGRSDIIKLSLVTRVLDQHSKHVIVTAAENGHEKALSDTALSDMEMRPPNVALDPAASPEQLAVSLDGVFREFGPDRIVICHGSIAARAVAAAPSPSGSRTCVVGSRANEPVYNSAGAPPINLVYNDADREALIRSGTSPSDVFSVGCPMFEVHDSFAGKVEDSGVLGALGVKPFDYFLASVQHEGNLRRDRLAEIMSALDAAASRFGKIVLFVAHPKTGVRLHQDRVVVGEKVRLLRSLNFFDFVKLEKNALAVLTDSTGVQEECSILTVPVITLLDDLQRPETVACGGNILAGHKSDDILSAIELSIGQPAGWEPPPGYRVANTSQAISKVVLGRMPSYS